VARRLARRGRALARRGARAFTGARRVLAQATSLILLDLRQKLKRALMFRLNFAIHSAIALGYSGTVSALQFFIYATIQGYPGWAPEQMLLFQAALSFWTGVSEFLFGGVRAFVEREVLDGSFDRVFLWPAHALVSVLTRGTNIYAGATVLAGLAAMATMVARNGLSPSPLLLLAALGCFAAGVAFYLALLIVYCACTLFLVKMDRLREVLDRIVFFASFPADIYAGAGKTAVLVAFPVALWVYFPVQVLLGRATAIAFGSVLCAFAALWLATVFWNRQEHKYVSAGG
jgi:ABC-2 type transport system permease protein